MARVSYKTQWLEVKRELEMVKRPWYAKVAEWLKNIVTV